MAKPSTKKKVIGSATNAPVGAAVVAPQATAHNPNLLAEIAGIVAAHGTDYRAAIDVAHLVADGFVEQAAEYRDEHGRLATRVTDKGLAHLASASWAPQPELAPTAQWNTQQLAQEPGAMTVAEPASAKHKIVLGTMSDIPEVRRNFGKGTREPTYPFDTLGAPFIAADGKMHYHHFFVAAEFKNGEWLQPGRAIGSSLAAHNRKWARETGETKIVTETVYQVGADGKRVKHDGHYVKLGTQQVEIAVTVQEREFTLRTAMPGDPNGPGAYVIRIK